MVFNVSVLEVRLAMVKGRVSPVPPGTRAGPVAAPTVIVKVEPPAVTELVPVLGTR
jgi:hypothetical protein